MKSPVLKKRIALISFALVALIAICLVVFYSQPRGDSNIAFYHWKTVYKPTLAEKELLEKTASKTIYLRLFDVASSPQAGLIPIARSIVTESPAVPVTPVVYIDNEALRKVDLSRMDDYTEKIMHLALALMQKYEIIPSKEIQFDCDWTKSTKDKFFAILKAARNYLPEGWTLSSTLRLYQFRHPEQAGIPPVDKVALMIYNMGNFRQAGNIDSIIDLDLTAAYFTGDKYPLSLDLALPLFNWGVAFDRGGNYRGLVREIPDDMLSEVLLSRASEALSVSPEKQNSPKWTKIASQTIRLNVDTEFDGVRIPSGWTIRIEGANRSKLEKLVELLRDKIRGVDTVIFYHLDEKVLSGWDSAFLKGLTKGLN